MTPQTCTVCGTISIHAPARGATRTMTSSVRSTSNFNPRTREGCDEIIAYLDAKAEAFQSTHPRGVRPPEKGHGARRSGISIHAPARGATSSKELPKPMQPDFNPRTREGCDRAVLRGLVRAIISIHAPARGATISELLPLPGAPFQSTHPRGVRLEFFLKIG